MMEHPVNKRKIWTHFLIWGDLKNSYTFKPLNHTDLGFQIMLNNLLLFTFNDTFSLSIIAFCCFSDFATQFLVCFAKPLHEGTIKTEKSTSNAAENGLWNSNVTFALKRIFKESDNSWDTHKTTTTLGWWRKSSEIWYFVQNCTNSACTVLHQHRLSSFFWRVRQLKSLPACTI